MSYSNISQVRRRNAAILTESAVTDEVIADLILVADSLIDSFLACKYTVPLMTIPHLIKGISADLASADALDMIIGNRGEEEEAKQANLLRSKSLELLKLISDGKIKLSGQTSNSTSYIYSSTYGVSKKFEDWNPQDDFSYWLWNEETQNWESQVE